MDVHGVRLDIDHESQFHANTRQNAKTNTPIRHANLNTSTRHGTQFSTRAKDPTRTNTQISTRNLHYTSTASNISTRNQNETNTHQPTRSIPVQGDNHETNANARTRKTIHKQQDDIKIINFRITTIHDDNR